LNKEDVTTGNGKLLKLKWRKFRKIIRLQDLLSIELLSFSPPIRLIEDMISEKLMPLSDFTMFHRKRKGTSLLRGAYKI
jgi:hypothetical protein